MFKAIFNKTVLILTCLLILQPAFGSFASDKKGYKGWEIDSPYNKLYDPKEREKIKGVVVGFTTVTPMDGMAPGTALILREAMGEEILVHICPEAYATAKETGIKKGDKIKVKGTWVEIDGEDVIIAAKIKKGEYFQFKVRLTSDGTPFWTMDPEQLSRELASN